MDALRVEWARRLRETRLAKEMTQKDLAEAAGISQVSLSNYELGLNIPSDRVKIALAKGLGVQVVEVFEWPDTVAGAA